MDCYVKNMKNKILIVVLVFTGICVFLSLIIFIKPQNKESTEELPLNEKPVLEYTFKFNLFYKDGFGSDGNEIEYSIPVEVTINQYDFPALDLRYVRGIYETKARDNLSKYYYYIDCVDYTGNRNLDYWFENDMNNLPKWIILRDQTNYRSIYYQYSKVVE